MELVSVEQNVKHATYLNDNKQIQIHIEFKIVSKKLPDCLPFAEGYRI